MCELYLDRFWKLVLLRIESNRNKINEINESNKINEINEINKIKCDI